jgi:hypothetical protein
MLHFSIREAFLSDLDQHIRNSETVRGTRQSLPASPGTVPSSPSFVCVPRTAARRYVMFAHRATLSKRGERDLGTLICLHSLSSGPEDAGNV